MLGARGLAELAGLPEGLRDLFILSTAIHDADKYLEIIFIGLRASRNEKSYKGGEALAKTVLQILGISENEKKALHTINTIVNQDGALNFHNAFDQQIKEPLINNLIKDLDLTEEQKEMLLTLNKADSVGTMPLLLARTVKLLDKLSIPEDEVTEALRKHSTTLQESGLLPEVEGSELDELAVYLLHCDVLSSPAKDLPGKHAIGLAETRIADIVARGQYNELDDQFKEKYNVGYWDLALLVQQGTERIIKQKALENNKVGANIDPAAIPISIFNILQAQINESRMSKPV